MTQDDLANKPRSKEARAAWYRRNVERERQRQREWRANNPKKVKAIREKENAKKARTPEAKVEASERRKAKAASPEHKELLSARYLRCNQARRADPIHKLRDRISTNMRQSLTIGKKRSGTFKMLGYTKEELAAHLERQFLPKMGWHNISKWHIDHIVPLASFKYLSPSDEDFKAAWALTNLRPVWAVVNLRKNSRREFLL